MIELLFLLGFSLHNIEEALWLPQWSKHARKYHKEVSKNEFTFAVIIVTTIGYLITFQYFIFASSSSFSKYVYLGFILMMVANVIFPHLIATIILKKYAPGTITGMLLNAPIGIYILIREINKINELIFVIICSVILAIITLLLINQLFKIGKYLFD
jgi:Protein of unknown function with HXXEE motif